MFDAAIDLVIEESNKINIKQIEKIKCEMRKLKMKIDNSKTNNNFFPVQFNKVPFLK